MSRWENDLEETFAVGDLTVDIVQDNYPDSPAESEGEDLFLIALGSDFQVVTKQWDCRGDFSSFILPKWREEIAELSEEGLISGTEEPTVKPIDGPEDEIWRAAYLEACDDKLEALLAACGALPEWNNEYGRAAGYRSTVHRMELWEAWRDYNRAHEEWACFELHVSNHGGGNVSLSLGEIYQGDHTDAWCRSNDGPDGFVMLRKSAEYGVLVNGETTRDFRAVAQDHLDTWSQYLDGDVWCWRLLDESGEEVEAGHSFYGLDYCREAAIESAKIENEYRNKQVPLFVFESVNPSVNQSTSVNTQERE